MVATIVKNLKFSKAVQMLKDNRTKLIVTGKKHLKLRHFYDLRTFYHYLNVHISFRSVSLVSKYGKLKIIYMSFLLKMCLLIIPPNNLGSGTYFM